MMIVIAILCILLWLFSGVLGYQIFFKKMKKKYDCEWYTVTWQNHDTVSCCLFAFGGPMALVVGLLPLE